MVVRVRILGNRIDETLYRSTYSQVALHWVSAYRLGIEDEEVLETCVAAFIGRYGSTSETLKTQSEAAGRVTLQT